MDSEKSGARRGPSGLEALYLMLTLAALVAAAKLPLVAAEPAEIFLGRVFMGFSWLFGSAVASAAGNAWEREGLEAALRSGAKPLLGWLLLGSALWSMRGIEEASGALGFLLAGLPGPSGWEALASFAIPGGLFFLGGAALTMIFLGWLRGAAGEGEGGK